MSGPSRLSAHPRVPYCTSAERQRLVSVAVVCPRSATCHTRVACTQTHGSARALKDALLSTKRSASLAFAMSPCADAIRKHVGAVSMEEPSACRSCFFQAFKIRTPGMVALSSQAQWRLLQTSFHQQGTGSARPTRTRPVERPSTRQTWIRRVDPIAQHEGAQRRSTVSSSFSCSIF